MAVSANLGFPRIGSQRELKKATEGYWKGTVTAEALHQTALALKRIHWAWQKSAGIAHIASNDFSFYDHVLDTAVWLGALPARYQGAGISQLGAYFAAARGMQRAGTDVTALPMKKWFDTNYHYIVPELTPGQTFRLQEPSPVAAFLEAKKEGVTTRPVLLGPVSFLLLARGTDGCRPLADHLGAVTAIYSDVISQLARAGAEWIQLDEPCFVQDRTAAERAALTTAYTTLAKAKGGAKLMVQTYFGPVGESYETLCSLPVDGLGFDLVRGAATLEQIRREFPKGKYLGAGVVDGRNIWINDLARSLATLEELAGRVGEDRLIVQPSCSLLHVPIDLELETTLDSELKGWLAFAKQKLTEVALLTRAVNDGRAAIADQLAANQAALLRRQTSPRTNNPAVRRLADGLTAAERRRAVPYAERSPQQQQRLKLPLYPTTTIGSYPQTPEVRQTRRQFLDGQLTAAQYDQFLESQIASIVGFQEKLGLDVLVHGEFERNDMVEYFGEQLDGFAFTRHGWVQSYGSRYVKPPVIFGDVSRPHPMTVRWWHYAQSQTDRPVKGMLTGPVTILQWSFVRDDQPRSATCRQIALAIRDEVADLEKGGARVIQVDEPAIREGLPLRQAERGEYLDWAVESFRIATSGVKPETQIQTHMCYSEFGDIIDAIADMDADVLLIENARSGAELLRIFRERKYAQAIGLGVYDIHSPRIPTTAELVSHVMAAAGVLRPDQLWVNPDCGLKTRAFAEVEPALKNMVAAARELRG